MKDDKESLRKALKVLGTILAIVLLLVVVAFGLIVGFCALGSRR